MRYLNTIINIIERDINYSIRCTSMAGLANAIPRLGLEKEVNYLFGQGFINNLKLGIYTNILFPIFFNIFKRTNHYRLYANLYNFVFIAGFTYWHYYKGTENTELLIALVSTASLYTTNKYVSQDLEKRLNHKNILNPHSNKLNSPCNSN
jgi:hypothetical protein